MADARETHQLKAGPPVHPVYLNVPMAMSFLAAIEGGVSIEDTTTRREGKTSTGDNEGKVGLRLPGISSLFGIDASGRITRGRADEQSTEIQSIRRHTEASLFNALYEALVRHSLVHRLESRRHLSEVKSGAIVEVSGEFVGNPLEPVVAFFQQVVPYMKIAEEEDDQEPADLEALAATIVEAEQNASELTEAASKLARSGSPARRAEAEGIRSRAELARDRASELQALAQEAPGALQEKKARDLGVRMLDQVGDDLAKTPVHDTVIEAHGFKVILTMSAEFFDESTRALLRSGSFRAVGKVTRVLQAHDRVNLLRRTALGVMSQDSGRELLEGLQKDSDVSIDTFDPVIGAPALQMLPLAVFV